MTTTTLHQRVNDRLARRVSPGDLVQAGGEVFLNAAMASAFWA